MSLAAVKISPSEFQSVRNHLIAHKPPYRTMHLRDARIREKKRVLRYLHAMHAVPSGEVEGMISGPGIFVHYKVVMTKFGHTQLNVLSTQGSDKELDRIGTRFVLDVLARVQEERAGSTHYPSYLAGQFYLRRRIGGMPASHPHCRLAVAQKALDARFVSKLASWDLELLHR